MKIVVAILTLIILYCLGSALFFMVGRKGDEEKMVKALTWRISLSLVLFALLFVGFYMGWLHPHPLILKSTP